MGLYLAIISMSYQAVIFQVFYSTVLERRYSRRVTCAGTVLFALAVGSGGLLASIKRDMSLLVLKSFLSFFYGMAYQCMIYKGTVKKRLLVLLTLYGALAVGEICVTQMVLLITKEALEPNLESAGIKLGYVLGFPIYGIVIFVLLVVWEQYKNAEWKSWKWSQVWLCVLFFFSQFIIVQEIFFFVLDGGTISGISTCGLLLGSIANMILFYAFRGQDKKIKMERKLSELRYLYEREELYFQGVEERQKELEKIRHDFKNQISVIGYLAEQDDEESRKTAREMARQLQMELGS